MIVIFNHKDFQEFPFKHFHNEIYDNFLDFEDILLSFLTSGNAAPPLRLPIFWTF